MKIKDEVIKTYDDRDLIYWKNNDKSITVDQAKEISEKIKNLISKKTYNSLLVDTRNSNGVWNNKVDKIWINLMQYIPTKVEKTATICDNIINKLQLNYLSNKSGNDQNIKAFTNEEKEQLYNFLKISDMNFLENKD
ncbi:MAG: hypothetical protein ACQEQE_05505 [Bacillota bacterium]